MWLVTGMTIVLVFLVVVSLFWIKRVRSRRPLTTEEKLLVAKKAVKSIRRRSPRGNRDVFERGGGTPDRHSGAILENSFYGDSAGGGGGGSD